MNVDSDEDYEILTSLEYKIDKIGKGVLIPLRFIKKGIQTVRFVSAKEPLFLKLDPDYRVPRMTDSGLTWEKETEDVRFCADPGAEEGKYVPNSSI